MTPQPSKPISAQRRRWLLGGVAGAAVVGGGWALWRPMQATLRNSEALQAFWTRQLQQLDGSVLTPGDLRGQPLLVNFWATWCPPCVRELPLLSEFARSQVHRGTQAIRVLGIAVDQASSVEKWLARQPLHFPVALAGGGGIGLTRSLGNIHGGLPFTLLFDAQGRVQQRKIGEVSATELAQWASLS